MSYLLHERGLDEQCHCILEQTGRGVVDASEAQESVQEAQEPLGK